MAKIKVKPVKFSPPEAHMVYLNVFQMGGLEKSVERQARGRIVNVMKAHKMFRDKKDKCNACGQPILLFGFEMGSKLPFLFTLLERKFIFQRVVEAILDKDPSPAQQGDLRGIAEALGKRWVNEHDEIVKDDQPDMEMEEEIVEADEDDEIEPEETIEEEDEDAGGVQPTAETGPEADSA